MIGNIESQNENMEEELVTVQIICPTCNNRKNIEISKYVITQANNLTTVSIPKGKICEHHFQAFIDKKFEVRGYQKVHIDVEFTPPKLEVQKKNLSTNNLEKQRRILLTKLEQNKQDIEAWRKLGTVSYLENKIDNAIHCFKRVVRINNYDNQAWKNLGILYYQIIELEAAIHSLNQAIKIDKHDAETWDYLGKSYGKLGKYNKSTEAFKNAMKENPAVPSSWYNLAILYHERGKNKKAKAILSQAQKNQVAFGSLEDKRDILLIKLFKKLSSI